MKIVSTVLVPEFAGGVLDGSTFMVVDITPEYKEDLLQRREDFLTIKKEDQDLYQLSYWDYAPTFYEGVDQDEFTDQMDRDEVVVGHPDGWLDSANPINIDCCILVVMDSGFYWWGYVKHTDVRISCQKIEWEMLDEQGSDAAIANSL